MAEARGFEPPVPVSEYNDLENRRLKPLGHASVGQSYKEGIHRYQARDRAARRPPRLACHRSEQACGADGADRAGFGCGPRVDGVWSAPLRRLIGRATHHGALRRPWQWRLEVRHRVPSSVMCGRPRARRIMVGRSQVVRQRILIPSFPGSNPGAPASLLFSLRINNLVGGGRQC